MKVDIIIKSFNRAWYLDRCITSIYKNVTNYGKIVILDDGTPEKYLNKIITKYPNVELLKSQNHIEKSKKIENQEEIDGYQIPSSLWIESVKKSSDYVLVIEDDVWFISDIDLGEIGGEMKSNNVELTKLGWQGNTKFLYNFKERNISDSLISQHSSKLFLGNEWIMNCVLHNKYKFLSILCRIGLANNQTINEYYNYLSILMGLYKKEFWLYTWKDSIGKVNEKALLKNAVVWAYKNKKNKNLICRTTKEYLKTTYISSSNNSYHKYQEKYNILSLNRRINEAWLNDSFNEMENYPKDFSVDKILRLISDNKEAKSYERWITEFKKHFKNAGAIVDY